MGYVLVKTNEFDGRYVALKDIEDPVIVGDGDNPESALENARAKGVRDPVLVYVIERGSVHIY